MNRQNNKPGVIVLGGHVQALGIVRIFGRKNIPVAVIDNTPKNIARHSKYCTAFIFVPDSEILSTLQQSCFVDRHKGWLLFPTNDFHVELLSKNKEELENNYIVTTDSWETIEKFYNKKNAYAIAESLNIPIAKTFFPKDEQELKQIDIVFPCIIKPAVMHHFYSKVKKKVYVCDTYEDLVKNYRLALLVIPSSEIIVQEIIQGSSKSQFSACYLFLKGKPYVWLTACRMRQHPLDFGNATTYAEAVNLPIIGEYAELLLNHTNYNGVCEVEFKMDDRDGEYKFLEVNTRTWKWHSIANKANTPFLITYYNHLTGSDIKTNHSPQKASFRHGLTDLPTQLQLLLKGQGYFSRVKKPLERAVWAKDDIKPWLMEKLLLLYLIRSR